MTTRMSGETSATRIEGMLSPGVPAAHPRLDQNPEIARERRGRLDRHSRGGTTGRFIGNISRRPIQLWHSWWSGRPCAEAGCRLFPADFGARQAARVRRDGAGRGFEFGHGDH